MLLSLDNTFEGFIEPNNLKDKMSDKMLEETLVKKKRSMQEKFA